MKRIQAQFLIWLLSKFESKTLLFVFDKVNQTKIKNTGLDVAFVSAMLGNN